MANLIQPVLDTFKLLLSSMSGSTLGTLKPFAEVKSAGVKYNFPYAAVEPVRTAFDPSQDQSRAQAHTILIQIGVAGSDPEALKTACVAYAQAVDASIEAWQYANWPSPAVPNMNVKNVFVMSIDYSSTYGNGTGLARFVDIHCQVEVEEWP